MWFWLTGIQGKLKYPVMTFSFHLNLYIVFNTMHLLYLILRKSRNFPKFSSYGKFQPGTWKLHGFPGGEKQLYPEWTQNFG